MEHLFETSMELWVPPGRVFAFFSDAGNLQRITPPELGFEILTPSPVTIGRGSRIEYRLHLFGFPFRWTTLISEWNPPNAFTDEQLHGPYAQWVHRHTFEAAGQGTVIRDRVRYRLPFAPFGEIAGPLVARQVRRIFEFRQAAIAGVLGVD